MLKIQRLALNFKALGGMSADTYEAIQAHIALADAIDASNDYEFALQIAADIVVNFNY